MQEGSRTPLPQGAGLFGPSKHKKYIDELDDLAVRLKKYLARDYKDNFEKVMKRSGGKELLGVCAYMDPRFKNLDFLDTQEEREAIKTKARQMLLEMAPFRNDPHILNDASCAVEGQSSNLRFCRIGILPDWDRANPPQSPIRQPAFGSCNQQLVLPDWRIGVRAGLADCRAGRIGWVTIGAWEGPRATRLIVCDADWVLVRIGKICF